MAGKLNDDILKFIVDIDGKPAQQGLNLVEKETRRLQNSNKALATEMAKLEAKGKKGTAEWKQYDKQIKANNKSITQLKSKQEALRKQIGVNNMTVKQLKQEYYRLKRAMDGANPNSKEWKNYNTQLGKVNNRMKTLKGNQARVNSLFGGLKTLMPALGIGAAVSLFKSLGSQIFNTRSEFEKYEAVLTTSLGSQKEAQKQMDMLVQFASETPFQLNELTGSFVKLTNYGLQPNREEMVKLGDVASSVGKSFDQFAEAIADAITGENERLKEFGIRAQKNGDKIKYTFKGVTTEVENNTKAIKDYLYGLGEMEGVAGSMAAISKTMGGQASNLADNFDRLWNNLGKGVAGGIITNAIGGMNGLLDVLNDWLEIDLADKIKDERLEVNKLVVQLTSNTIEAEKKKEIYNKLKEIQPDIVEGINIENIETGKLVKNLKKYNDLQIKKIALAQYQEDLNDLNEEAGDIAEKRLKSEDKLLDLILEKRDKAEKLSKNSRLSEQARIEWEKAVKKVDGVLNSEEDLVKKAREIRHILKGTGQIYGETSFNEAEFNKIWSYSENLIEVREDEKRATDEATKALEKYQKAQERLLGINNSDANEPTTTTTPKTTGGKAEPEFDRDTDPIVKLEQERIESINQLHEENNEIQSERELASSAEHLTALESANHVEVESTKLTVDEKTQYVQAGFDLMAQAASAYGVYLEAQMNRELKAAGDNEAKKDKIREKYAQKQKRVAKAQVWINAAQAVLGTWAGYASMSVYGTVVAGLQTAAILATAKIQSAAIDAQEWAEGNVMDIIGRNTGRKYRATVSDGRTGIYSQPTYIPGTGIVGEKEPELIVSGPQTRHLMNNYPWIMDAIAATAPEYAAGNVSTTTNNYNTPDTSNQDAILLDMLNELKKPKRNFVTWDDIQNIMDDHDDLMDDVST